MGSIMTAAWVRPAVIIGAVAVLLTLNAREFKAKRRALEANFAAAPSDDAAITLARAQAFQAQTNEQLLHMIHTMLAAILAALLWR
jgi:hypothetical protein